jgi:hypothetical protein
MRAIDRHETAICDVLDLTYYRDEVTYAEALVTVAPRYDLTVERLDSLTRAWCAVANISVPN